MNLKDITLNKEFYKKIKDGGDGEPLHLVIVGTKPDIIKQSPLILELLKRGKRVMIGHTGQHYSYDLNRDASEVFGLQPDFNLNAEGNLGEKSAKIIMRLNALISLIKKDNSVVIPYVHGDTTTAAAASKCFFMSMIPVVHIESGLRTHNPKKFLLNNFFSAKRFSVAKYFNLLADKKNWIKGSIEPYPEQFNTRIIAPAAAIHYAPTSVNKTNLISEGFGRDRIVVLGNTISDAVVHAFAKKSDILNKYPKLKKGFIRFSIHRRENVYSRHRFMTIFEAVEELIKQNYMVLWIFHNAAKSAIDNFKLKSRLNNLKNNYSNFIFKESLWPYHDNIRALSLAAVNVTDSGGELEEGSILGVPTVTVRFGSDRPETIWNGLNILGPPVNKDILLKIILAAPDYLKKNKNLYGQDVSAKIVDKIDKILSKEGLLRWEHERFGFDRLNYWRPDKI